MNACHVMSTQVFECAHNTTSRGFRILSRLFHDTKNKTKRSKNFSGLSGETQASQIKLPTQGLRPSSPERPTSLDAFHDTVVTELRRIQLPSRSRCGGKPEGSAAARVVGMKLCRRLCWQLHLLLLLWYHKSRTSNPTATNKPLRKSRV